MHPARLPRVSSVRFLPSFALVVALLSAPLVPCGEAEAAKPALTGSLETVDGVRILRLWGTPRERGYAQGWLLAEEIVDGADQGLGSFFGGSPGAYADRVLPLAAKAFAFEEDEVAELEGLAEGIRARLPERTVRFLGRLPTADDLKVLNTFGDWYALGCSSAAVWGSRTRDGTASAVRNFDFMRMDLAVVGQHVRVVAPRGGPSTEGPERAAGTEAAHRTEGWVGVSYAGSIGTVTAMSAKGVYVAIHDVPVRPGLGDFIERNVPRLVALRRLVETLPAEGAVEKAAELCRSWSTLFGNNLLVATPEPAGGLPAGVLEYDSRGDRDRGVTLRGPDAPPGGAEVGGDARDRLEYVACSNHHRLRGSSDCSRYRSLIGGCAEGPKVFDLEALIELVERASVPQPGASRLLASAPTLHQAIARTGERHLWVRLISKSMATIREARGVDLDVRALLASVPPAQAAVGQAAVGQAAAGGGSPEPILLWPEGAPGEEGDIAEEKDTTKATDGLIAGKPLIRLGSVSQPAITVYPAPQDKSTGAAVIVCPGGGYNILAMDLEGTEVVEWLNSIGVTGVLLKYRVPARKGGARYRAPLQDAQRALGIVRERAGEWGIDPARIGVLGFSAGAHLSAVLSCNYETRTYERVDAADERSSRPDFTVLVYPAYLTVKEEGDRIASELEVTARTPPTFIVQTQDDGVRVETSLFYYLALKAAKVPVEMHLYPSGGHGYGLRPSKQRVTTWPQRAEEWMRDLGVLQRRE
jgi:acetyl esterase/lipase